MLRFGPRGAQLRGQTQIVEEDPDLRVTEQERVRTCFGQPSTLDGLRLHGTSQPVRCFKQPDPASRAGESDGGGEASDATADHGDGEEVGCVRCHGMTLRYLQCHVWSFLGLFRANLVDLSPAGYGINEGLHAVNLRLRRDSMSQVEDVA